MATFRSKVTWFCYMISLIVFIVVFAAGSSIVENHPSGYVTLSFYIVTSTTFISALTLGIWGNFLKWLYPIMAVAFAYLFSIAVIYSDQVYLYLHHNHGVNDIHSATDWTFFHLSTAVVFLGLIIGIGIRLIIGKSNTTK